MAIQNRRRGTQEKAERKVFGFPCASVYISHREREKKKERERKRKRGSERQSEGEKEKREH